MSHDETTGKPKRLTWLNDPNRREEADQARAKGRANRKPRPRRPRRLETARDLDRGLDWLWDAVAGEMVKKDEAKILLDVIKIRSERLRDTTLAGLQAKVDQLVKQGGPGG